MLWVLMSEESPNQVLNGWGSLCLKDLCIKIEFSSAILSWNLRILQYLKRKLVCASVFEENIRHIAFFL